MKVLVACEYSGVVRDAFLALGHQAMSCDILPTDVPGPHYQGDVRDVLHSPWDLMIAHPPCTYLSVSGMHWTTRGLRDPQLTEDAMDFVKTLLDAPIPLIALENPVSIISSRIRKPDQIIQPWMFGHDASKKTCLWLKGLNPLVPDLKNIIPPRGWEHVVYAHDLDECEDCGEPYCERHKAHYHECDCIGPMEDEVTIKAIGGVDFGTRLVPPPKPVWANQTPSGQNKLGPSDDRWKLRSETFTGIASAMATQWGGSCK
jgi:hypothetical protein